MRSAQALSCSAFQLILNPSSEYCVRHACPSTTNFEHNISGLVFQFVRICQFVHITCVPLPHLTEFKYAVVASARSSLCIRLLGRGVMPCDGERIIRTAFSLCLSFQLHLYFPRCWDRGDVTTYIITSSPCCHKILSMMRGHRSQNQMMNFCMCCSHKSHGSHTSCAAGSCCLNSTSRCAA